MKATNIIFSIFSVLIIGLSSCTRENNELRQEANRMGDAMCRSVEAMNNLRNANPADTASINKYQEEHRKIQEEMAKLHEEFNKKFAKQAENPGFRKQFSRYLSEAMVECRHLSKDERENFRKQIP